MVSLPNRSFAVALSALAVMAALAAAAPAAAAPCYNPASNAQTCATYAQTSATYLLERDTAAAIGLVTFATRTAADANAYPACIMFYTVPIGTIVGTPQCTKELAKKVNWNVDRVIANGVFVYTYVGGWAWPVGEAPPVTAPTPGKTINDQVIALIP